MLTDAKQNLAILGGLHRGIRMGTRVNPLGEEVNETADGSLPASLDFPAKLPCSMKMMP